MMNLPPLIITSSLEMVIQAINDRAKIFWQGQCDGDHPLAVHTGHTRLRVIESVGANETAWLHIFCNFASMHSPLRVVDIGRAERSDLPLIHSLEGGTNIQRAPPSTMSMMDIVTMGVGK